MTNPVKHISISIDKSSAEVYGYASDPNNFPKWVAFIHSMVSEGDGFRAETENGSLYIVFTPDNDWGVIDHVVILENGATVQNPLRVISNGAGSEVIFSLFHVPGRTEEEFEQDVAAVQKDLATLKQLMESRQLVA